MQNNSSIQDKIEQAINALDKIKRASPTPFFYTRLMARLATTKQNMWDRLSTFIIRPATAFAVICLVILMNVIAAYLNLNTSSASEQAEVTSADEYSQVATNFYDFENLKP